MKQYIEHHENGTIKVQGQTNNEQRVGIWSFFKKNGRKAMEAHFSDSGEPLFNFYFDNRGSMIEQGYVVIPYPNGQTQEEGLIKNCLKQGAWNYYDPQGNKRVVGEHKNGIKQGLWQYFDETGKLQCQGQCEKNRWHGAVTYFNPDGSIKQELKYHHGATLS